MEDGKHSRPEAHGALESQRMAHFRVPGWGLDLGLLLARALPELESAMRTELVSAGRVRIGTLAEQQAEATRQVVSPGVSVHILRSKKGHLQSAVAAAVEAALSPHAPGARQADSRWRMLVPALPWRSGELAPPNEKGWGAGRLAFRVRERRGHVAEMEVHMPGAAGDALSQALRLLAKAGHGVLGDVRHGGILVDGGLRVRCCDEPEPATWWPYEPLYVEPVEGRSQPSLVVSRSTERVLERGHPWIMRDADTGATEGFAPGTSVCIAGPTGADLGAALIDRGGDVVARRWSRAGEEPATVEHRVQAALDRRGPFLDAWRDGRGEAFRCIHGEADHLPGFVCERFGAALRVWVGGRCAEGFREGAIDALREWAGEATPVVQVLHLRHRPAGRLECVRLLGGAERLADAEAHARRALEAAGVPSAALEELAGAGRILARESGLDLLVDLGLAETSRSRPGVGLFLDQRANRARLVELARGGGRWLNLFAHTGAFSVALLAAGAECVVSVDLSPAYLRWLDANLALNRDRGVDPARHESRTGDGRRYLEELDTRERFAGIVLDPPTAAAAGRRFWSSRRDLEPLVVAALRRLSSGGSLLLCRNDHQIRDDAALVDWVEQVARGAGVRLDRCGPAPAGEDFPVLEGFPEGDPFRGVLARIR